MAIDLTSAFAIWGAILSSALAIREFCKDRRRINISCGYSFARNRGASDDLNVHIMNVGYRAIEIHSVGVQLSDGLVLLHPSNEKPKLPVKLFDGDSVDVSFPVSRLEETLQTSQKGTLCTAVVVSDGQDKIYRHDPYKYLSIKGLAQKRTWWKRLTRKW